MRCAGLSVQRPGLLHAGGPKIPNGYCYKLGGPFLGVLMIRALLLGVYIGAPDFGNSQIRRCVELGFGSCREFPKSRGPYVDPK